MLGWSVDVSLSSNHFTSRSSAIANCDPVNKPKVLAVLTVLAVVIVLLVLW